MQPRRFISMLFALGAAWTPATADPPGFGLPYEEVEPGVTDVDPLAVGLRELSVDLHQPNGFENVYLVPGQVDRYMRVEGGLFAVFPRSEYSGSYALIPSGTVFHIGAPPTGPAAAEEPLPPRASRLNTRLTTALTETILSQRVAGNSTPVTAIASAHAETDHPVDLPAVRQSTILNDMDYRRRRLRELMARATTTGQGGDEAQRHAEASATAPSEHAD